MRLNKKIFSEEGEFELVVIKREEFGEGKFTTSNVLSEGIRRGYLLPAEKQTNLIIYTIYTPFVMDSVFY